MTGKLTNMSQLYLDAVYPRQSTLLHKKRTQNNIGANVL